MKHVKKFEQVYKDVNTDDVVISSKTIYFVSDVNDSNPEQRNSFTTLDDAIERVKKLDKLFEHSHCIYEFKIRILTEEDLDLHLTSKNYNL